MVDNLDVPRYKTLDELRAAYAKGDVAQDNELVLDNDCVTLYERNPNDEFGIEETQLLFDGGFPDGVLREALKLLGIPSRGA